MPFKLGQYVIVPVHSHTMGNQAVFAPLRVRFLMADGETALIGFPDYDGHVKSMRFMPLAHVAADITESRKICASLSDGWSEYPGVRFSELLAEQQSPPAAS